MTQKINRKPTSTPANSTSNSVQRQRSPTKASLSSNMKLCIILGLLSFVVYANTFHNGYAGDDEFFIENNSLVNKGIKGIPELLTTAHMQGFETISNDTYRPLSLIMFAIEHELLGNNPTAGHLINILLFSVCVALLFLFLDNLMEHKRSAVAFITALLFAIHPIHTEVVANIKSRDELLCFVFAFWSLNFFLSYFTYGNNSKLIAGTLTLFLSLLSKETSVSFIMIIPLIFFFYSMGNKKRSINITTASIIAVAVFLYMRAVVLHGLFSSNNTSLRFIDNQLANIPTNKSGLATAILSCGYYIKLLFIPYPLLSSYSFSTIPFVSFADARVLLSLAIYLFIAFVSIYRLIKFKKDLWALGILFYLLTIALFSNIIFLIPALLGEQFLFFASVGFCLLVALFIEKMGFNLTAPENTTQKLSLLFRTKVLLFLAPVVIVFSSMTLSRNNEWENNYVLYKADMQKAPKNARLYRNLGAVLLKNLGNKDLGPETRSRMIGKGMDYFKQSIAIYPGYSDANAGLGECYMVKKMFDSAEKYERMAITLDSLNTMAVDHLAVVYFNTGRFSESLHLFAKVMQINPRMVTEYRNIGLCYLRLHKCDSAILNFREALNTMPENADILYGPIVLSFKELGQMDSVKKYELLMKQLDQR